MCKCQLPRSLSRLIQQHLPSPLSEWQRRRVDLIHLALAASPPCMPRSLRHGMSLYRASLPNVGLLSGKRRQIPSILRPSPCHDLHDTPISKECPRSHLAHHEFAIRAWGRCTEDHRIDMLPRRDLPSIPSGGRHLHFPNGLHKISMSAASAHHSALKRRCFF